MKTVAGDETPLAEVDDGAAECVADDMTETIGLNAQGEAGRLALEPEPLTKSIRADGDSRPGW